MRRRYHLLTPLLLAASTVPVVAFGKGAPPSLTASIAAAPGAAPLSPANAEGDKLTDRYVAGLESSTSALEKVIAAQANQINIFSWMVAIFGLAIALGGLGLYRILIKTVRDAVDERVSALVASGIDVSNARSIKLHAIFLETTFSASRDIATSRHRDFLTQAANGELDLNTPAGLERLVNLQAQVLLFPMAIVATIYGLAASDGERGALREKTWVLFSEVAAGNITPQAMLNLVTALMNVLHHRQSRPVALEYLQPFAAQLRDCIAKTVLPGEPAF